MVMLWGSVADRPPTMHAAARLSFCLVAVALAVVPSGAGAEVYKCAGEGAIPVYQEVPCAKGRELRNFQTDPPEITILPAPSRANPAPSAAKNAPANDAKSGKDAKPGKSTTAGDASERKLIRTGMTEAEVLAKLGYPDMTTGGKNGAAARWIYMPAPGDPETITSLTLTKGAVTEIDRKIVRK
jgi:hypothetical protein